jgi:hypothetical protein
LEEIMQSLFAPRSGPGGNGAKTYQCSNCGGLITTSDHLLAVAGNLRHLFVNPAGIEFHFYTFASCHGAIATGSPTIEYTWFSGHLWQLAFCRACGHHLGWRYSAESGDVRPREFWGLLIAHLLAR